MVEIWGRGPAAIDGFALILEDGDEVFGALKIWKIMPSGDILEVWP